MRTHQRRMLALEQNYTDNRPGTPWVIFRPTHQSDSPEGREYEARFKLEHPGVNWVLIQRVSGRRPISIETSQT